MEQGLEASVSSSRPKLHSGIIIVIAIVAMISTNISIILRIVVFYCTALALVPGAPIPPYIEPRKGLAWSPRVLVEM